MSLRTRFAILVGSGCALGAMLLTGCSGEDPDAGTNGVGKLSPTKIEQRTRKAAAGARSVRMSGTVITKGKKYRLDMRLKAGGGVGEVTTDGSTFELLRVGKDLFLKADEEFYRNREDGAAGGPADEDAASKLEGKYVKVPSDDPSYKQLSGFTDMDVLLDGFFVLSGKLATDGRGRVGGVKTIVLTAAGGKGGSVEVALEGRAYPLRYKRAGRGGTIELSDYNEDFTLKAPDGDQVVDYGEQMATSG